MTQKIVRDVGYQVEYSYAGFQYCIFKGKFGWQASPVTGEHPSAWKTKHRLAAVRSYREEYGEE